MIKYKIELSGTTREGLDFLKNLSHFSNLGATIVEPRLLRNLFPHKAFLYLETEEILKSSHGVTIHRFDSPYTKEELEEMDWDEFKEILRKHDIGGRQRSVMINKYLALFN